MPSIAFFSTPSNCSSATQRTFRLASGTPNLFRNTWTKHKSCSAALLIAAVLITGCGGTPDYPVEDTSANTQAQTPGATYSAAHGPAVASSFTLNPAKDFNGFNPEDWNNQQSWVECNCGNNDGKKTEPQIMTWNPNA